MSKHSEAPWILTAEDGGDGTWTSFEVVEASKGRTVCFLTSDGPKEENGHLIAAAPEMLEMLRRYASECLECHGSGEFIVSDGFGGGPMDEVRRDCFACRDIHALISKAEGKS